MRKYEGIALNLILFVSLFVFLRMFSEYHFYCVEQNQLFLHTWDFISLKLMEPGGLAMVIAQSFVQLFILPNVGALITASLLTSIGTLSWTILRRVDPATHLFFLAWLPSWALLFMQWDFNYLLQGTIAYGLMLAVLYLLFGISCLASRLVASLVLSVLLFFLAGPVATLFALSVLVFEIMSRSSRWYYFLLPIGLVGILGILSVYYSLVGEYRFVFLPDGYYHFRLVPGKEIYFSWSCFLASLIGVGLLRGKSVLKGKMRWIVNISQLLLLMLLLWIGYDLYGDKESYHLKNLEYLARTEQWDSILEKSKGRASNQLYACYQNLALAHKGKLADDAFKYDQCGPRGLAVAWNKSSAISALLSEVYFAMGNVAVAQEMAFESNIGALCDGNPRMVKRLIETNLIYGAYPVAEKYIAQLEKTFYYADWARGQRRYLYNDAAVESDPVLGNKRACLLTNNQLSQVDRFDNELMRIVEQNPSDKTAMHYLGIFYLLAKDIEGFERMIDRYYGTKFLPTLPHSFQEAVIISSEKDPDRWRHLGIPEATIRKFTEYKQQVLAGRGNSEALPGLLYRSYGNTYWYYYMFK